MLAGDNHSGDLGMELRRLGTSGLKVSAVGLGCNNFGMRIDQAQTQAVVDAALEAGITLFDTADIYGGSKSEVLLGEALKGRREKAVIATKFANPMDDLICTNDDCRPDQSACEYPRACRRQVSI